MKISELFSRINIGDDEKARRVLNVSNERATITADEIENGVTIERLAAIGVPVFRYSTQVTIHGRLPDFDANARPAGYKAIFRNQNGSLGVRYVAIDGAKKKTVRNVARMFSKDSGWSASIDSTGLHLMFFSMEKQPVLDAFQNFPRALIYGSIYAGACALGGYAAFADIGAVPAENVWPLCKALFNCESELAYNERQAAADAAADVSHAQWQRENEDRTAKLAVLTKAAADAELAKMNLPKLSILPHGETAFVRILAGDGKARTLLYIVRKRAFGQLCYGWQDYDGKAASFEPSGKMKRFDAAKRARIEKDMAAGLVFDVQQRSAPAVGVQPSIVPMIAAPSFSRVQFNRGKNGLEIHFGNKPAAAVLSRLKGAGWRWSSFNRCWYTRATVAALEFSASLVTVPADELAKLKNDIGAGAFVPDRFDMQVEDNMAAACGL
jgi:hypothetical protein